MRRRTVMICAGVALAMALGGLASGALKTKSRNFTVAGGDNSEQGIAKCKRGERAVSGGFFGETDPGNAVISPADSARKGKRKWRFLAGNVGGTEGTATVYAYCDKDSPELNVRRASETVDSPATVELTARCRRGEEAVAGGFDGPGEVSAYLFRSKRAGKREWTLGLFHLNLSGGEPTTYTALAYCDETTPRLRTRSRALTMQDSAEPQSIAAKCTRRQELRSGGFEVDYAVPTEAATVHGSRRSGKRRWEASAFPLAGTPELTVYAYCARGEG